MADPLANVPEVPSVDAAKAKELVEVKKFAFLDVRTVEEYEKGHVAGSVNVPYLFFKEDGSKELNPEFLEKTTAALPDPHADIVVSCQMGRRGALATKALQDAKYTSVVNLDKGLSTWTCDLQK